MASASDIIVAAFGKLAVYDPTTTQTSAALSSLNSMISSWGVEHLQPVVVSETMAITQGDAEYTIGSGGDLDTVRPMRIENLRLRDSDDYDHPVEVMSPGDYNRVSSKTYEATPKRAYFLPEYPLAKLIFEYEPDAAYTAYIESLKPFTEFTSTATTVSLPVEYKEALVYNLAIVLGEDWDRRIPETVIMRAKELKNMIASFIAGTKPPAMARFDSGLSGRSHYNINTDC